MLAGLLSLFAHIEQTLDFFLEPLSLNLGKYCKLLKFLLLTDPHHQKSAQSQ